MSERCVWAGRPGEKSARERGWERRSDGELPSARTKKKDLLGQTLRWAPTRTRSRFFTFKFALVQTSLPYGPLFQRNVKDFALAW
eukprot:scaffold109799_cov25-Cyclotella_meneghiniana.AAC.1